MAEDLVISSGAKAERYEVLLPQLEALVKDEQDLIANLANIAAALYETFQFFWVGFYIVKSSELVLGPFQGPIACTRIRKGAGVCGVSWDEKRVVVVPDVAQFPGHIVCNANAKSEIVLPAVKENEVYLVLDIDSNKLNDFDQIDEVNLQRVLKIIEKFL